MKKICVFLLFMIYACQGTQNKKSDDLVDNNPKKKPSKPTTLNNKDKKAKKTTKTKAPQKKKLSDDEAINLAHQNLTTNNIGYQNGTAFVAPNVIGNLQLPVLGLHNTTIAWASNNPALITNVGDVTQPSYTSGDANVVLTATMTKNSGTPLAKDFNLTIQALAMTDSEAINLAHQNLTTNNIGYQNGTAFVVPNVVDDLILPVVGLHNTTIAWASSNPVLITDIGIVTRPPNDTNVTLTATMTKGTETPLIKDFILTVPALITRATDQFYVSLMDWLLLHASEQANTPINGFNLGDMGYRDAKINSQVGQKHGVPRPDGTDELTQIEADAAKATLTQRMGFFNFALAQEIVGQVGPTNVQGDAEYVWWRAQNGRMQYGNPPQNIAHLPTIPAQQYETERTGAVIIDFYDE